LRARALRGLRAATLVTVAGLACLAPVLFTLGPITVGLFMLGVLLVAAGVVASGLLLARALRARRSE